MAAPPAPPIPIEKEKEPQFPLPKILTYYSPSPSPSLFLSSPSPSPPPRSILITQGAEARLYKTSYLERTTPCALKHRPPKPWRHPALDARLTRHRILAEARTLVRCRREGVPVPAVYALDEAAGWLMMEWVEGPPVRVAINEWLRSRGRRATTARKERDVGDENAPVAAEEVVDVEAEQKTQKEEEVEGKEEEDADLVALMRRIGAAIGRMHKVGIVHGDLTTSNMMLRPWDKEDRSVNGHHQLRHQIHTNTHTSRTEKQNTDDRKNRILDGDIVIIDFGLASQSHAEEDRAVDLYVLERAFASTHPRAEALFSRVLEAAYGEAFRQAPAVLKKLEEVRMRGRKRSMLG